MVIFRGQEPLLRYVPLASSSNLQRWNSLYVAVPVGLLAPGGEYHALPGSRVIKDHLQHRLAEQAALTPQVGEQEEAVAEQPTQVEAGEGKREEKREASNTRWGLHP